MSWQSAVGSFLTSPGFGGVMATAAAGIAYRGIVRRLAGDRQIAADRVAADSEIALTTEALSRWTTMFYWVWEQRAELDQEQRRAFIAALNESMTRQGQAPMLEALTLSLLDDPDGDAPTEVGNRP